MSVRIAIVPFNGRSTQAILVCASADVVELGVPAEHFRESVNEQTHIELPELTPIAARMLADALRNAADAADRLFDNQEREEALERTADRDRIVDELADIAKSNVPKAIDFDLPPLPTDKKPSS